MRDNTQQTGGRGAEGVSRVHVRYREGAAVAREHSQQRVVAPRSVLRGLCQRPPHAAIGVCGAVGGVASRFGGRHEKKRNRLRRAVVGSGSLVALCLYEYAGYEDRLLTRAKSAYGSLKCT